DRAARDASRLYPDVWKRGDQRSFDEQLRARAASSHTTREPTACLATRRRDSEAEAAPVLAPPHRPFIQAQCLIVVMSEALRLVTPCSSMVVLPPSRLM